MTKIGMSAVVALLLMVMTFVVLPPHLTLVPVSSDETTLLTLLESGDAHNRAYAARSLATSQNPVVGEALVAHLNDPDAQVGKAVMEALLQHNSSDTYNVLGYALASDNATVRQRALTVFQNATSDTAVPVLAVALEDERTASQAADALIGRLDDSSHNVLLSALADDTLTIRRYATTLALQHTDAATRNYLMGRALASNNVTLRSNAMTLYDSFTHGDVVAGGQ